MSTTTAFDDSTSGKALHIDAVPRKSPGISALEALAASYSFHELDRLAAAGKPTVWGVTSWEAPLIFACGTIPVSFADLWRERSIEAEAIGENYFQVPAEFCSMIKALIGRLHLLRNDNIKKILYFGSTCESLSIVMELVKEDGYDIHCIENITSFKPEERRPEVVEFFVHELQEVARWLTGKPVDEEKLKTEIRRKNLISAKIRRILDLRLKSPFHITSIPTLFLFMGSSHYFGRPEEYVRVLDLLIHELETEPRESAPDEYIPLVFTGFGVGIGILNVIEESHAAIVGWELIKTGNYREDVPPLESIAHYVLDAQSRGELGPGAGASATARCVQIEELVRKTGARGIISSAVTGCPYGSVAQQIERDYFKKKGIPIISLEATVHVERPTEEQVMRVKTFIEMLS
jgi:benzoyl-CoA reductase/2-hydroxyglutaryl-CoA dehydratase subunit BcrC/BadD/HgdB